MAFTILPQLSFTFWFFILSFLSHADMNMNAIDRCWRANPNYSVNRAQLASCSVGFAGKMTVNKGGDLKMYQVMTPDDDPVAPKKGTLRYGATMIPGKVWITFKNDMGIRLKRPLVVSSFTTIDGRGVDVHIAHGDGFLLHKVKNVIIHGLNFHHNRPTNGGPVVVPGGNIEGHGRSDGDAISIVSSNKIWIDHNTLSQGQDGLIDITHCSTNITVSNNWFRNHDKVMLLGHTDDFDKDRNMKVTIAFNRFGPNCTQRMPRIRYGYAHVANNFYDGWKEYAIGGSMNPSITSQSNIFVASKSNKGVIRKMGRKGKPWSLKSEKDAFFNGAYFLQENKDKNGPHYGRQQMFAVESTAKVRALTKDAGALRCQRNKC